LVMLKTSTNRMAKNRKRINHKHRRLKIIGKLALDWDVSHDRIPAEFGLHGSFE
jgi:hypothetical protein